MQVVVVALEHRVRLDVDLDVEVARRAAVHAGLAFAGQAHAVAFVDAGRDLHRERLLQLDAPRAEQVPHGLGMMLPLPWQRGQVCAMEKGPCDTRTWPAPRQVGQVAGCVPGCAPLPLQVSHVAAAGMRILVSKPCAACSSVSSRL